jgi:betaine-aldehyde dehydrogenase
MSASIDDSGQQYVNGRRRRGGSSDPYTVTKPSNGDVLARHDTVFTS